MSKRLTKEEIVERARKVHGDKYDYSLFLSDDFKYERIGDDIPIICPIHRKYRIYDCGLFRYEWKKK